MSDSLTNPAAQWTVAKDAAVPLKPLTFYVDGSGNLHATDDPANAVGNTTGFLKVSGGSLQLDTSLASGLAAIVTPAPRLLAYT